MLKNNHLFRILPNNFRGNYKYWFDLMAVTLLTNDYDILMAINDDNIL